MNTIIRVFYNFIIGIIVLIQPFPMAVKALHSIEQCQTNSAYSNKWQQDISSRSDVNMSLWSITGISISPDGTMLAVANTSGLTLYDTKSMNVIRVLESNQKWDAFKRFAMSWSPDSSQLAVARYIYTSQIPDPKSGIQIWNISKSELTLTLPTESESISWSTRKGYLASVDRDGIVTLWNTTDGQQLQSYDAYHKDGFIIDTIAWSPDGSILAGISGNSGVLYFWNDDNLKQPIELKNLNASLFRWSNDSKRIVIGDDVNSIVQILDVTSYKITERLDGSDGNPFSLEWSPDGKFLARGTDKGLFIWNMSQQNQDIQPQHFDQPPMPEFRMLAWMPDSKEIFSVTFDGTIYKWDVMSGCVLGGISSTIP